MVAIGFVGVLVTTVPWRVPAAAADPEPASLESADQLDDWYLTIGPMASLVHVEGVWDGGFGGEGGLVRVRERSPLTALGLAVGAMDYAARDGGRVWIDLFAATRAVAGVRVGASLGGTAEVDRVRPFRGGAQATLWFWAGVTLYARVGTLAESGTSFDVGLKVPLPAIRWPGG